MKTEKNILIAFILNLIFCVFEFSGGVFTGSVAIISDSIHDLGDAAGIGLSFIFEKKSKKEPDENYTFGYGRYSVIGSIVTTLILLFGCLGVIFNSVFRIFNPSKINYNGMIVFAIIGVCVNFCAAYFTRQGDSLNQKAINLHMLEDVLGWLVVLIGATVMRFTDWSFIDPIMSVGVSIFILINAAKNIKKGINLLLEKTPAGVSVADIAQFVSETDGVTGVHHIHVWSIDGQINIATMHVVTNSDPYIIKKIIKEKLINNGISHSTIEIENENEMCIEHKCNLNNNTVIMNHCHHHH